MYLTCKSDTYDHTLALYIARIIIKYYFFYFPVEPASVDRSGDVVVVVAVMVAFVVLCVVVVGDLVVSEAPTYYNDGIILLNLCFHFRP